MTPQKCAAHVRRKQVFLLSKMPPTPTPGPEVADSSLPAPRRVPLAQLSHVSAPTARGAGKALLAARGFGRGSRGP